MAETTLSPSPKTIRFEDFLVEKGFLTKEAMIKGRTESSTANRNFFDYLISEKFISEEKLTQARGLFFNLPYVDLRTRAIPREVIDIASKEAISNYKFVPFELSDSTVKVALTDPTNLQALEALEFLSHKKKYKVELYITSFASFQAVFKRPENITTEVSAVLKEVEQKEHEYQQERGDQLGDETEEQEEKIAGEAPISKVVDVIIRHAIQGRASDIHIEPSEDDLRVRYRIDGVLHSSLILPKTVHPSVVSRIKILANLKIDESRLPQDGRFHISLDSKPYDFRVSTFPTIVGEKVVLRILDKSAGAPTLPELGVTGTRLEIIEESMKRAFGMFLLTGPTGSGKSTTLYAILSMLNKPGVNIVTLEDPVEYFIDGVNQGQIKPEIGLTFATGLRFILRQDPNIIMVGEIRDKETAELAVNSALTGHLVLSTLHTNSAIGAIPRLIDMGVEPFLLTAAVNVLAAQRLVRKICDKCVTEQKPTDAMERLIKKELEGIDEKELEGLDLKNLKLYSGRGCPVCGGTGFRGRIGIFEILRLTKGVQALINEKALASRIQEYAVTEEGMILMKQDGMLKALRGLTTVEEVILVTKDN